MTVRAVLALLVMVTVIANAASPDGVKANYDLTQPFVLGTWGMLWAGQLFQLATLLSRLEDVPNSPSFAWWLWIRTHPFTMLKQLVSGQIGYALLAAMPGQLTVASALVVGYAANDFATKAATRVITENRAK